MNLHPLLQKLGLNKKEADVYLICLEYGPETMTNIARISGRKRSTLYNIIEGLMQKGVVILVRRNRKTFYDVERPKKLLTAIRAREQELEKMLPELERIRNTKQPIPHIEVYEGEEAIRNAYDAIYASFDTKRETCFLTSVGDLQKHAPFVLESYLAKTREKSYHIRELIFNDEVGRRYVKDIKARQAKHAIRLLPADFPIYNDVVIYGDKVAFFSFRVRSFVTIIDNSEVAKTMMSLYEWAWTNSRL